MSEITSGKLESRAKAGKYLTFRLDREVFGVEIRKVREIIGIQQITKVPRTKEFVRGVINLRGSVIPVIDLRKKFGMEQADDSRETCIIVIEINGNAGLANTGIVVDSVSEVLDINQPEIGETPDFGRGNATEYILGMAKAKDSVKILLDIDRVLTAEELSGLLAAGDQARQAPKQG